MKEDIFKKSLKDTLPNTPQISDSDNDLWNKIQIEITEKSNLKPLNSNNWLLYSGIAASLVLFALVFVWMATLPKPGEKTELTSSEQIKTNPEYSNSDNFESQEPDIATQMNQEKSIDDKSNLPKANGLSFSEKTTILTVFKTENKLQETKLSDGSVVTLNQQSNLGLSADFNTDLRELNLKGEAFFEVSPNPKKPFIVNFGNSRLKVLGTKFNIRNYPGDDYIEVTVKEGLVEVFANKNNTTGIKLKASDQLKIFRNDHTIIQQVDPAIYDYWTKNKLDFNQKNLAFVFEVLSRKFDIKIELAPQIKECLFSGDLNNMTPEEIITVVAMSNSLSVDKKGEKNYYIAGISCE